MAVWSGSPSTFGSFHKVFLPIKNAPAPPKGTRTERTFLRYHLACRKTGHSARCQHTGCPITQATRQKILRRKPFPSALGGPFAAPLFAPLSALRNSLWMRLQLYFRFKGLKLLVCVIKQYFCPFVKYFFPQPMECVAKIHAL